MAALCRRTGTLVVVLVAALVCGSLACGPLGGRTVVIAFDRAEGLRGGEPVVYAGQRVGVAEAPALVDGAVRVRVRLTAAGADGLPPGAVFIPRDDRARPGSRYLEGFDVGVRPDSSATPPYDHRGVANELELALLVGVDRARSLWEGVGR